MRRSVSALLLLACPVACTSLLGLGDHETLRQELREAGEAALEATAPMEDSGTDAQSSCPGTAGPKGIRMGASGACIDSTEVTTTHYLAFLAAKKDTSGQPAFCAWNTSYQPIVPIVAADDYPVRGVDWCDARAYCEWAGKRLCGKMANSADAGSLTFAERADHTKNQWLNACSSAGIYRFPYGNVYVPGNCSDTQNGSMLRPAGALPNCKTPAGVFDMIGNVIELLDACGSEEPDPRNTSCLIVGGGFKNGNGAGGGDDFNCQAQSYLIRRDDTGDDVGFRCCSW